MTQIAMLRFLLFSYLVGLIKVEGSWHPQGQIFFLLNSFQVFNDEILAQEEN
jgi:hypothetical protein